MEKEYYEWFIVSPDSEITIEKDSYLQINKGKYKIELIEKTSEGYKVILDVWRVFTVAQTAYHTVKYHVFAILVTDIKEPLFKSSNHVKSANILAHLLNDVERAFCTYCDGTIELKNRCFVPVFDQLYGRASNLLIEYLDQ